MSPQVAFLLLLLAVSPAWGRSIPQWPYQKLWDTADIVVVVEPLGTVNNTDGPGDSKLTDVEGVTTTFKVHAVFKGGKVDAQIAVKHFDFAPNTVGPPGALFIRFAVGPLKYQKVYLNHNKDDHVESYTQAVPCWLAFLKRNPDGSFAPVTGQFDCSLSFKELHDGSFFLQE